MRTTYLRHLARRRRQVGDTELAARAPSSCRLLASIGEEQYLDALELRDAVLGDGVVLNEAPDGGFVLHLIVAGRARALGWFADAAAAWRALDAIDDLADGRRAVDRDRDAARAVLLG